MLWPESPPAAADTALSALLSKLRRALGDGALSGRSELRLTLAGDVELDVERAAVAARRAEAALQEGDWGAAARRRATRSRPIRPTFLPDCDGPWLHEQRARARRPARARARGAGGGVAAAPATWPRRPRRRAPPSSPRRSASRPTGC